MKIDPREPELCDCGARLLHPKSIDRGHCEACQDPILTAAYREAMASYPVCACGQALWAPASIERGHCEGCR